MKEYSFDCFEKIECLWKGETIEFNKDELVYLMNASAELENDELSAKFAEFNLAGEEVTVENCIQMFRIKESLCCDNADEFAFMAANLSQLDLSVLTVDEIERLLLHESLRMESENWLLDSILELIRGDEQFALLFKYVQYEHLDPEHLEKFFDAVYTGYVDLGLWKSLTKFITNGLKNTNQPFIRWKNDRYVFGGKQFERDGNQFNGIFAHLTRECGGNPHDKGVVEIKYNNGKNTDTIGGKMIDYNSKDCWSAGCSARNPWIQFDFKERSVSLRSYIIQCGSKDSMIRWKVEGSNDESSWTRLDYHNHKNDPYNGIGGQNTIRLCICSENCELFFRYIRLTDLHKGYWSYDRSFVVGKMELFGFLDDE